MYRLLIVDDEPQIVEGLSHILDWNSLGFSEIITVQTYRQAMESCFRTEPNLVLCDVCLRESSGVELLENVRQTSPNINWIMISGYDDYEYVRSAMKDGACDYLLKPVDRRQLQACVEEIIVSRLHGSVERPNTPPALEPVLGKPMESYSLLIQKILRVVYDAYSDELNLTILAGQFFMNKNYLGQVFYRETGMKFGDYLRQYRMEMARRLLATTDHKVSVVARQSGYRNMNLFYAHFQARFHMSPTDVRARSLPEARCAKQKEPIPAAT